MKRQHEFDMYPPRVTITAKNNSFVQSIKVKFSNVISEDDLDMNVLLRPQPGTCSYLLLLTVTILYLSVHPCIFPSVVGDYLSSTYKNLLHWGYSVLRAYIIIICMSCEFCGWQS